MRHFLFLFFGCIAILSSGISHAALDVAVVRQLAAEESEDKIAAIQQLGQAADPAALAVLKALNDDALYAANGRILIVADDKATDAATGEALPSVPDDAEGISINNRIRAVLANVIAGLRLFDADRTVRLAATRELQSNVDPDMAPLLLRALDKETDPAIKALLKLAYAQASLGASDPAVRLAAVKALGESSDPSVRSLLLQITKAAHEPDGDIRSQAELSMREIDERLQISNLVGQLFTGLSLGSILLLAALGLAITYGVMGVINMAHGELLMVGAYATYGMQSVFRSKFPELIDWYLVAAIPVAFFAAAIVGMLMERTVIRWLYGRALETLLATWGLSLILIQAARVLFGAQNVEVSNPTWMSGGFEFMANVQLPFNRVVIIGFSLFVLALVWVLMNKTRLGMFVRAVTQNRTMAGCVGVPTAKIDTLAFGLGAGIAGLGGVALSQISNVGPDMGQGYIVDSFMVVVLGGVGQLAGAVWAALGLGIATKFIEGWAGAVIAKILVLVFIIIFIQKRPQGLFALKGRFVDN
ncbi:MAG: urea ABC transporter permease subunit UrtB [Rugosibacter sp.]